MKNEPKNNIFWENKAHIIFFSWEFVLNIICFFTNFWDCQLAITDKHKIWENKERLLLPSRVL